MLVFSTKGIKHEKIAVLPGLLNWKARKIAFTQTHSKAPQLVEPTFLGLAEGFSSLASFWI